MNAATPSLPATASAGARPARGTSPASPDDAVTTLPGLGGARGAVLTALGIVTVADLLRLAPRRYEDRRHPTPIASLEPGEARLVIGTVSASRVRRLRGGLALLEAELEDASGRVAARWFVRGFLPRALPVGARYALYGRVAAGRAGPELVSPERERLEADALRAPPRWAEGLVPVHPLTRGVSAGVLRRAVAAALPLAEAVPDAVPRDCAEHLGLPPLSEALRQLHFPVDVAQAERARARLACEELLLHEIGLALRRAARQAAPARPVPFSARVHERIRARLPFALTGAQERVVGDVVADLKRSRPMHRLLQGDVGSGKTLVAAYALLGVVAARRQAALLAPTEVLARQHAATFERLLAGSRVRLATLVGGGSARERAATRRALAAGELDLVVGTHALLSAGTHFRDLALLVIDEQHKFGVAQRAHLLAPSRAGPGRAAQGGEQLATAPTPSHAAPGNVPHCLVMTATPIPRTLALTVYGDLDLSLLDELPPGRGPTTTWVLTPAQAPELFQRVRAALARGEQAYVVYPLVDGDDSGTLRDATAGCKRWAAALPGRRVGLLHGRLPAAEKATVLTAFRERRLDLLVATVVVEVGVDVPNATLLVVEHAERFGLTQLHQLRGRVGRGGAPALCALIDRSEGEASERLAVLARTHDGFRVAEEDLALRGVGDLLGTRQHGSPDLGCARLPRDLPLLLRLRDLARALLASDPTLARPEHAALAARLRAQAGELPGALGAG